MPEQNHPTESAGERSATHDDMCERIEVDIGVGTQVSPCYCDYRSLERDLTAARQRIEGLEERETMRLAGISTAAFGYWKKDDSVHPDYVTTALHDVADLYAKYAEVRKALTAVEAERDAIRLATIEECAKVCEKRAETRFMDYGITEDDTNASYYPKSHEWCDGADEEANDCATEIRHLKEKS